METIISAAASTGAFGVLRWCVEKGAEIPKYVISQAMSKGEKAFIEFLLDHNKTMDESVHKMV